MNENRWNGIVQDLFNLLPRKTIGEREKCVLFHLVNHKIGSIVDDKTTRTHLDYHLQTLRIRWKETFASVNLHWLYLFRFRDQNHIWWLEWKNDNQVIFSVDKFFFLFSDSNAVRYCEQANIKPLAASRGVQRKVQSIQYEILRERASLREYKNVVLLKGR